MPSDSDLESRIGSHWLNRIGIAAVLIGVSYFLKYAFDNNWIGPAGRVTIGLLAGIAVVIWSERFRSHGYQIFSYSLKAVGIGVLYLSLWAAFHVYSLIPSGIAFVAMLAVTASTAFSPSRRTRRFSPYLHSPAATSTPLLLSTGVNKELQLFSYVALLDAGRCGHSRAQALATPAGARLRRHVDPVHRLVLGVLQPQSTQPDRRIRHSVFRNLRQSPRYWHASPKVKPRRSRLFPCSSPS